MNLYWIVAIAALDNPPEPWMPIAFLAFSALQTVAISLILYIMKDIRDRVVRLENLQLKK